jgi:hypothetical protein
MLDLDFCWVSYLNFFLSIQLIKQKKTLSTAAHESESRLSRLGSVGRRECERDYHISTRQGERWPEAGWSSGSGWQVICRGSLPSILWLFLKNGVNVALKSNKQKKLCYKISFLLASWRSMTKIAGSWSESGSISQRHGSADPDPPQMSWIRNAVTKRCRLSWLTNRRPRIW